MTQAVEARTTAIDVNGTSDVNAIATNTNNGVLDLPIATAQVEDIKVVELPTLDAASDAQELEPEADLDDLFGPSDAAPAIPSNFDALPGVPSATTTIPPVVDRPQSDVRQSPLPVTQDKAAEIQAENHELDMNADLDLAIGLDATSGNADIERSANSAPTNTVDEDVRPTANEHTSVASEEPHHTTVVSVLETSNGTQPLIMPAAQEPTGTSPQDSEMVDAPALPLKVARERDDDPDDGPAAKRTKIEENGSMPPPNTPSMAGEAATNGRHSSADVDMDNVPTPISPGHRERLLRVVKGLKKSKAGINFRAPVVELWPSLAVQYSEKITKPMDLGTLEKRLNSNSYSFLEDFKADVSRIYENTVLFNGENHDVTKAAFALRDNILSKIAGTKPAPSARSDKKAKKEKLSSTPVVPRAPAARRNSRSAGTSGPAASGVAAPTFAPDPSGLPIIRRDSTVADGGRPKREIHPPKSKDLVYNSRPKKKKFATELRFCDEVINNLKKPKYAALAAPFLHPVDPVALGIPNYFSVIKKPMDLTTIHTNLQKGHYENAKEFEADVRQIFKNCYKYNPANNPVHIMGKNFEAEFDREWARKNDWIADHAPLSTAASPSSTLNSDEEDSEEEEEEEEADDGQRSALSLRLIEEQNKLIDMLSDKKTGKAVLQMQQEFVDLLKGKVEAEMNASAAKSKKGKSAVKASKKKVQAVKKERRPDVKRQPKKPRYIGQTEKEFISKGMESLPETAMEEAVMIIRTDMPDILVSWSHVIVQHISNNL